MQIGIEDVIENTSTKTLGVTIIGRAKLSVVANSEETKAIAKHIDELQKLGDIIVNEIIKERYASKT